MDTIKSYKKV